MKLTKPTFTEESYTFLFNGQSYGLCVELIKGLSLAPLSDGMLNIPQTKHNFMIFIALVQIAMVSAGGPYAHLHIAYWYRGEIVDNQGRKFSLPEFFDANQEEGSTLLDWYRKSVQRK